MKKFRKGFTIVELVIVIAVIAILSAILIPVISGLINKARMSNDILITKRLNIAMESYEIEQIAKDEFKEPETMTEVIKIMAEKGLFVEILTPTATGADIVWDSENNRFILFENDVMNYWDNKTIPTEDKLKLWVVSDTYNSEKGYSVYLKNGFTETTINNVTTGLDVGENTGIATINYNHTGAEQNVIIRTNGGILNVNAPNDTIHHYGSASIVNIQDVAETSYHENGETTFIKVTKGRIVVEKTAEVGGIHVKADTAILAQAPDADLSIITIESTVTTFKLQTTNVAGVKLTESTVTVGGEGEAITTEATTNQLPAVPQEVKVKVERTAEQKSQVIKTESIASEAAAQVVTPVGVARIGAIGYATLDSAVNALQNGETLILLDDIERDTNLIFNSGIKTVDLNGHTLRAELSNQSAIKVNNSCTLNLIDSSTNKTGKIIANRKARAVSGIEVYNATVNIYGGDIYGYSNGVYAGTDAILNIYGGVFTCESTAPINLAASGATLNLYDGLVNATKTSYAIMLYDNTIANISGGDIRVNNTSSAKAAIKVTNACSLEIGGDVVVSAVRILDFSNTGATQVTINDGTYTVSTEIHKGGNYSDNRDKATFNISGGTFNMEPSITGFKNDSTIGTVTNNGDGTWTVSSANE